MSTPTTPKENPLRMILVMGSVGLIASVLLVVTFRTTEPYIARNRAEYLERALFEVLPGASSKKVLVKSGANELVVSQDQNPSGERVFAGYDSEGKLVGVAIEAQGQGYADVVRLLYGYDPGCACVIGLKVLESKETPGLGDRIDKDPAFLANFKALDVQLAEGSSGLAHPLQLVKAGARTDPWQVEAITGATISSKAVTQIIDRSAALVVPLIRSNLEVIEASP